MDKLVKEQLSKCKVAYIPPYNDDTREILIAKTEPEKEAEVHKYYIIYIEDYVINEPDGFTLSANWNKGTKPLYNYYRVYTSQLMGKMMKVIGVAYDPATDTELNSEWQGWLPTKSFKIIKEL